MGNHKWGVILTNHLRPGMILQVAGGEIIWEIPEMGGLGLGRSWSRFPRVKPQNYEH